MGQISDNTQCAKMDDDYRKAIENLLHVTEHITVGCVLSVNKKPEKLDTLFCTLLFNFYWTQVFKMADAILTASFARSRVYSHSR